MNETPQAAGSREQARAALQEALYEIKRVIVGQDAMLERLLVSLLAAMTRDDGPLTVVDTHGGAGLYGVDTPAAELSGDRRADDPPLDLGREGIRRRARLR